MTELLREPFENLAAWRYSGVAAVTTATIIAGRNGNCVRMPSTANYDYTIPAANESDTLTVGMAIRVNTLSADREILRFDSDSAVAGSSSTNHNRLRVKTTGAVEVQRGATVIATSAATALIAAATWAYVELQIKLHDTTGTVIVKVNGTERINLGSLDTRNAGTKTVYDTVRLTPATQIDYDDLYIKSGAGETFLGDIVVAAPTSQARMYRQALRALVSLTTLAPSTGATMKVWSGSAFVDGNVKVWTGSAFVDAEAVHTWNGSAFV